MGFVGHGRVFAGIIINTSGRHVELPGMATQGCVCRLQRDRAVEFESPGFVSNVVLVPDLHTFAGWLSGGVLHRGILMNWGRL